MKFILLPVLVALPLVAVPAHAAELLFNPREIAVELLIRGQSPTLVIANDVNARMLPTLRGNGGAPFARLSRNDEVYVLGCEGFAENHFWVQVYIPQLKETGYVAAEFLQNNYNHICQYRR
ncbi:hypothetical protein H6F87_23905 [Cyanobacteria bacterium FACHB-502]|nr:hypothetical protein [Cyanobacteria bacterium FACHB-502]